MNLVWWHKLPQVLFSHRFDSMVSTRIFSSKLSVSQLTAKNIFLMYSPGLKFTITIKQNNGKSSLKDFAYKIGVISEQVSTPEA